MQKQQNKFNLLPIGIGLVVLAVVVHLAVMLAQTILPLANIALIIGVILVLVGLMLPRGR